MLWCWWRGGLSPSLAAAGTETASRAAPELRHAPGRTPIVEPARRSDRARGARRALRGPLIPRRLLAVTLIGVAVLGAVTVYQAGPI